MELLPDKRVTDLRATIEGFAAKQAAAKVNSGESAQALLNLFSGLENAAAGADYEAFASGDRSLHKAIIDLADVPVLTQAWETVFATQAEFREDTMRRCWPDLNVLFESHRDMVDAIAGGQPEEAMNAAVSHLDAIWFRLALSSDDDTLPSDPLSRACAWLAFHFRAPVRLPELAEQVAGCSSGHLARLFRDELGLSFSEYVIELRLQKAAQMLQTSENGIQDIANRVGYADPSRFSMHFRRRFGLTPKAHRKTFSSQLGN